MEPFEQNAHAVWNEAVAIQVDTAGEIVRQLKLTLERIDALTAAQPTDWQQWYLPQLRREVEQAIVQFGEKSGDVMAAGAEASWAKGVELVDQPLAEGPGGSAANLNNGAGRAGGSKPGIRLEGMVPRLDRGQLLAMQHFMTSKMKDVSTVVANRVNQELGLVVTGLNTPAEATTAIQGLLGGAVRRRALTIVRTELGRAFSTATQGRMEQARKAGVSGLKKQWRRSGKLHSRRTHDLADGQIREVDEPFLVGGEKIMFPRDPKASPKNTVNCGCTQLPYMDHWQVTHKGEKPFTDDELAGSRAKRDIQQIRDMPALASGGGAEKGSGWQTAPRPVMAPEDLALRTQVLAAASADGSAGEHLAARNLVDGREWPPVTSGMRYRVTLPADLKLVVEKADAQVHIHHDHPDSTSFSSADMGVLHDFPGIATSYVHGHDGTVFSAARTEGRYTKALDTEVAEAVKQSLASAVKAGRLWSREASEFRRHAINEAMARAGVLDYNVQWSPDVEVRWNSARIVIEGAIDAGKQAAQEWIGGGR